MRIRDILADLVGVICLFAIGYCFLFLGYGIGF